VLKSIVMQLLGVVGAYLNSHEQLAHELYILRKKGTKAVTEAVPFQKVHFCTQRLHIGTLVVHINT